MAVNQFVEYPKILQAAPQIFGIETHILLTTAQFCSVKSFKNVQPRSLKGAQGKNNFAGEISDLASGNSLRRAWGSTLVLVGSIEETSCVFSVARK